MNENESKNPLISVIIPVYKVEQYLHKCIDSVINQTYSNLEIILVDDGSPDNCGMICDEYSQKDSRIRVIHKENGGLSDARNAGLDIATGDYIGFVDSDDYISIDMYSVLIQVLLQTNTDISMCGMYDIFEGKTTISCNGDKIEILSPSDGLRTCIYEQKIRMCACNKLYKKNIFDTLRYPKGKTYEDAYIISDIFLIVSKASVIYKPLYYYYHRPMSITTSSFSASDLDKIEAYEHVCENVKKYFPNLRRESMARLLWVYLSILDKSCLKSEQKELNKRLQRYIRNNIKYIIDSFFTKKRKLMAIIACISVEIYRWCIIHFSEHYI